MIAQLCCWKGCKKPALSVLVIYEGDTALEIPFCTQRKHGTLACYVHRLMKKGELKEMPEQIDPERLRKRKLEVRPAQRAIPVDNSEQCEAPVHEERG